VFQIVNWLVYSATAREELETMRHTHMIILLPAYDINGDLITPIEYL